MNTDTTRARPDRPSILIEVGADRLKMIRTAPARRGRIAITHLHVERIESATTGVSEMIRRVVNTWPDTGRTPVILCLPRQMVTIRNLDLPSTDPAEIDEMVGIQTAKLTPWSRDEVLFDYSLREAGRSGYSRAMLVIAQRTMLRQRFYIAEEAGLEPERLSISSEGLILWARRRLKAMPKIKREGASGTTGQSVAVLDVDSFYSDFLVLGSEGDVFSRAILTGTNHLAENEEEAVKSLARDVAHSLERADGANGGAKPGLVLLTGAAAISNTLAAAIREQTGIPCESVDPLEDVTLESAAETAVPASERNAVSWTALIGMACDPGVLEINLMPDSVRMRRDLGDRAKIYSRLGMAVMAFLLAASFFASVRFFSRREQLHAIRQQVEHTLPDVMRIERQSAIAHKAATYREERFAAVHLLDAVHPAIPPDVLLEAFQLDLERGRLAIRGSAPAIRDVRDVVNQLEAVPAFRTVREDGATTRDARTERFQFNVICTLEDES